MDEREMCVGIVAGDPKVISEFVRRAHRAVYAHAARLTPDRDLREDWAQECMMRILADVRERRFVYRHPGSLWAWFGKRAYYLLLDDYRAHKRLADRIVPDAMPDDARTDAPDPLGELERREAAAAVESRLKAIERDHHRRAIRFFLMDELKYTEIAEVMQTSLNNVRTWVRRGRLALRECLTEKLELSAERDT